jgi:hypothetical protein
MPDRDSNQGLPEYESRALSFKTRSRVNITSPYIHPRVTVVIFPRSTFRAQLFPVIFPRSTFRAQLFPSNTSTDRSQISGSLPRPKANLAETHQHKAPTPKLKSTTNVLTPRTKIQTFTGKQDSSIQMHPKTDLDVWNSALGMY